MSNKLDQLVHLNGKNLKSTMFMVNLFIIFLFVSAGFFESQITQNSEVGDFHVMIGIIPFAILGTIFPFQLYTLEFYQKARYYMIKVTDVYKYHMISFYGFKNIVAFLGTALIFDIGMYFFYDSNFLLFFVSIASGYLLSPLFVTLGFYSSTLHGKKRGSLRIALLFVAYILIIAVIVTSILVNSIFLLFIYSVVGIGSVFLFIANAKRIERKLEV